MIDLVYNNIKSHGDSLTQYFFINNLSVDNSLDSAVTVIKTQNNVQEDPSLQSITAFNCEKV